MYVPGEMLSLGWASIWYVEKGRFEAILDIICVLGEMFLVCCGGDRARACARRGMHAHPVLHVKP